MSDISDQRRYYERMMDEIAAERQEQFDQLRAENAKLVDVLHEVEQEAVYAYRCLQQDCVTIADSVEHFFKMWWHAECELDRTREENAKLRELVEAMPYCMEGKCLECPLCSHFEPAIGDVPECEALPMLYALGIYGDDEDKLGVTPF